MLYEVLAAVIGYLLGSIPFGYLAGKSRGVDVRKYGSGATGGTNVLRTLGPGAALFTGLSDLLKGTAAAYVGWKLAGDWGYFLAGTMALVGHSYPVWLKFKGGKSVATGAGALILFHPLAFLAGLVAGVGAILPTKYVSLGSLVGALAFCGTVWLSGAPVPHHLLALAAFAVVYVRHWSNIKRMIAGTENKLGQKARPTTEP